uniref:Uncharacterized protein n=1 Tax=Leersia perrieri TaxID=77586 RepID=A0A0D9WZJ8_9ORYZ
MPCAPELANGEAAGAVKVGTTGTIGSLMTRELEAINKSEPATPRRRRQGSPVSVPCVASPRKIIALRKSSTFNNVSDSGRRTDRVSAEEADAGKLTARRSSTAAASSSPMLRSDGSEIVDGRRRSKAKKAAAAAGCRVAGVEVVDVRCGNPMSSRLRRLGFSKLSETFA